MARSLWLGTLTLAARGLLLLAAALSLRAVYLLAPDPVLGALLVSAVLFASAVATALTVLRWARFVVNDL